jgi:hypothetical protein
MSIFFLDKDVVSSYRKYYIEHKQHIANWGNRGEPDWWINKDK